MTEARKPSPSMQRCKVCILSANVPLARAIGRSGLHNSSWQSPPLLGEALLVWINESREHGTSGEPGGTAGLPPRTPWPACSHVGWLQEYFLL